MRRLRALAALVMLVACGAPSSPASSPTRRAPSEEVAASARSPALLIQTPDELRDSLGDDLPTECEEGSSGPCRVALYRLLRDELRASPGQELTAALFDAILHRDEPDGELAYLLVRERAHAAGGDAAWFAAVMELTDAVVVMAATANADPSWRNRLLARGLPSPCPRLAQTVPSMEPDAQRSALARAEGACALACPEGLEALRAGDDDRETVIVRSCGPQLFGLASADDARLFADDPTALLALRGLTHTHEATRALRERPGIDATRVLLERVDAALARAAIDAHVPARVPLAEGHLRLPVAGAEDHGRASLVVVLGAESVHLGARPWIGLSADGAPVRRGDPIPGPPLASTTDTAVLAQALHDALARTWRAPAPPPADPAEEAPRWLDENGDELAPPAAPRATPIEVDVVADASTPIGRVVPLLAALDAARFHDPQSPEETLRPFLYLSVTAPDGPARVRVVPRVEGAPAPPRSILVTATDVRERPRPSRRASDPPLHLVRAEVGVIGSATLPLARALEAIGDLGGEPVIELAVEPPAR